VMILFVLGLSNVHAALSAKDSSPLMAPVSVMALVGNVAVWWPQLVALVVPTATNFSSSLAAALEYTAVSSSLTKWWNVSTFCVHLNMCQLSLMSLLLLAFNVRFHHIYEVLLRGWPLLQGLFVFLPLLSIRAGFSGEEAEAIKPHSEDALPLVDVAILALYCTAVASFFFGSPLDRIFWFAAPTFYTGVLGGYFRLHVPRFDVVLATPDGWDLNVRYTIALWMASLFFLRFEYMLSKPKAIKMD